MKLSFASVYALRALAHLAGEEQQGREVASHVIARVRNIPDRFLLKVLRPLVQAGLVLSVKGPNGGYRLARPASRISVLEVVEAQEGPMQVLIPDVGPKEGSRLQGRLQVVCEQVTEAQRRLLAKTKVSDLVMGKA